MVRKVTVSSFIIIGLLVLNSCVSKEKSNSSKNTKSNNITTKYAMSIVFMETPYLDIKGANYISKDSITNVKHFEFDYDAQGRLIESRYVLNDELIAFNDRFVRAPKIKISYQGNLEIRTFYNEYGHRTLVSGDVYETRITLNEKGERIALTFYGLNGKPIENDFGIVTYHWETQLNGSVIESRYNLKGALVRNRPEFQYMITKFVFDQDNMLTAMTNLGLDGKQPTPDDSGVISTRIKYDEKGRFVEWANFDAHGNPIKGMTNLAKIIYKPSAYFSEEVAIFMDEHGKPQNSNWGVHKIIYTFDTYGNEIERTLMDTLNLPTNSRSGLGILKSTYTSDGKHLITSNYFDKDDKPIGFGENQVHQLRVEFDDQNRPVRSTFYDLNGNIANGWSGYATEEVLFDEQGRLTVRQYLDSNEELVNNQAFDIARFVYEYMNDVELQSVKTYDAESNEIKPQWNPNH